MEKRKVTVIGSINMDLVTKTEVIPKVGETVMGESFFTIPGGKGANQAVAAARLGAEVTLIGCVGDDMFGKDLLEHLEKEGIILNNVEPVTHVSTGTATITLSKGDNSIIVVSGANFEVTPEMVRKNESVIAKSDVVLLQLEIPLESVMEAAKLAKKHNKTVILNPAPIQALPKELLSLVDYLTPNEHEQELLLSASSLSPDELEEIKSKCIVTKGPEGVFIYDKGESQIKGFKVEAVDTTGAGDSFNGAFAVSLSEGIDIKEACRFANAVGALSVTKLGAQSGMPTKEEVERFLQQREDDKS
ncbi:ribokinase [Metabacillus litoralis]|uniref:ribokinase n=1 Tax=Bacillaceae TaxID=186817 RepID=UPI000BFE6764|nr:MULTISPECIES: ribokinase [Bacillaceae]PGT83854.1 ribokinase [Bacillus sp. AFS040349]UHA61600.1 ribokinase [Metabacillus litoralis]